MKTQSSANSFGINNLSAAMFLLMVFCLLGMSTASAERLKIKVIGVAADGTQADVTNNYRWTVEEDATKLSIPGQPATTANYSFSFHTSYMPVVAAGRVGTTKVGSMLDPDVKRLYEKQPIQVDLDPAKRYYVSIAAEGYQMGGAPVVFSGGFANATVYVNQYDLPGAQVSVYAFNDNNPINGTPDLPEEVGLEGFTVQLFEAGGTYGQSGGQVTQDAFGNPLGTTYNEDGSVKLKGKGIVLTDKFGVATIKNLFPAKYTVVIVPPVGSDWHQTSTIEGTRGSDAWLKNNEPSFFQEFGPPGHHVFIGFTRSGKLPIFSDTRTDATTPCAVGVPGCSVQNVLNGSRTITGRIVNIHNSRPPLYNFEKGAPVPECWVGLNETGGGTRALYAAACNKDSTFTIPNVPNGTYELVVWDDPLDMILGTQTVTVNGGNVAMGDVPVFSWFARYQGRVFQDIDGTGLPFFANDFNRPYIEVDPKSGIETEVTKQFKANDIKPPFGEGIANNIRFRDGSIYQSVITKKDGTFAFTELFPFFNWMIAEIDYARFKATGATMVPDAGGAIDPAANAQKLWKSDVGSYGSNDPAFAYNPWIRLNPQLQQTCSADDVAANKDAAGNVIDYTACFKEGGKYYRTEQGVILLEGMQTFLGQTNHIEWGKMPYGFNENGGIAGIVHYAITRAEDDPRYATAENWEPGIPRVQINLFLDCDADGKPDQPMNDGSGLCNGLSSAGYQYVQPDVDNYPFCWRDPESCGLTAPSKGDEDVVRGGNGTDFSYGDVFRWGALGNSADQQLATGLSKTDSWDDSIPGGCVKPPPGAVGNGGIPFAADLDCFDGLYNFNQIQPAVFDGGYAFGRVAGQPELPMLIGAQGKGTYIVEAVAPPGYLHQGNGDKNVVFGDSLKPMTAALPFECVGMELPVPAKLTLFADHPDADNPNFGSPQYPGNIWHKCDMKAVPLLPGTNPAPDFHMFTEAPVAGHGVGFILDDTASEFNRFAPTFGEKYAPPHLPISIQDWTGRELSRTYSDQFGSYNFLVPSSFTINPPFPSGVMPSMMVSCMNHPGPVKVGTNPDGSDKMGIDPFFNRKYTQFCYTLQYLAGKTTYLDTPVLPIAAFASVEKNPLDCECQDKTPAIYSVNNGEANSNYGPWVPGTGGTLTIVSMGSAVEVPNPAYDPTLAGSPKHITRDYGFGTSGTVKLGGTTLSVVGNWDANILTVNVPGGTSSGQLTITRGDSGKETVVGLTVHVGGPAPIVVTPGGSIQAVIDNIATQDGALITIPPGTYNEYVILDKRVRLQGWGAGSVIINASKASAGGLDAWRKLLAKKIDATIDPTTIDPDTGLPTVNPGPGRTFDILPGQTLGHNPGNNEPIIFGAEEGPGILAVGKQLVTGNGTITCANASAAFRIDGVTVTGSDAGGGILASGYDCNLEVTNNRMVGNYGSYGGGVRVGHTALANGDAYSPGFNSNVKIHHNWISQNGATEDGGGGGITLGTGSDNYFVNNNYVCGNFSMSDGGGIGHYGLSGGTNTISNNKIVLNQTFNQSSNPTGGGLFIGGQVSLLGNTGSDDGVGRVVVDANLIQYNHAGAGAGGGVSVVSTKTGDDVLLTNNMIVNNATAYAGGGIALADASGVRVVNNTVASNASTATNQQSFPAGPKVQSTAQIAGIARISGASPTLLNNIIVDNQSFTWSINTATSPETTTLASAGIRDLGIVGSTGALASTNSVLTTGSSTTSCTSCISATVAQLAFVKPISLIVQTDPDQPGVLPETTILQTALTFDEGGNFINVIFSPLTMFDMADASKPRADYHIALGSVAINAGAARTASNGVPTADFDGASRPGSAIDIGADELFVAAPTLTGMTPNSGVANASYAITLTGTNLAGATLSENASNFSLSNVVVVNSTQITATVTITSASLGAKTITVTTQGGTATADFTVVAPPAPTLTGITPNTGVVANASYAVTLTGTNLTGATLSENSSNFSVSNVVVVNATTMTATVTVSSGATIGPKQLTVTTAGGTASVNFTVVPAVAVSFTSEAGIATLNGSGTTLSFGNLTGVNQDTVTLTIGGTVPVTFGTATVNGSAAFSKVADTCSGTTQSPGATCTIAVSFNAPSGTNAQSGTLSVPYTGATGSPVSLSLTGS